MTNPKQLLKKIKEKKAKIAVIGLGYVGLPLAKLLAKNGFIVNGYTRSDKKMIKTSKNFTRHAISSSTLQENDVYIICVPTPTNEQKAPDLTSLKQVAKALAKIELTNKLIINESTVAPFTTRKLFGALGNNYFLVCSPERINPGSSRTVENIEKIIGGINNESLTVALALYKQILKKKLVVVKNMEVAEMSKMLENTYRAVNIALVNEFAKLAESLDLDILEVINAAKTKWSFQAHYPSLGVGGHCIPVDPYYILKLADENKLKMPTISQALHVNESMPQHIAEKIIQNYKKPMKVLIYGLTYKKNVADLRESPVLILCELLKQKKVIFSVYDPLLNDDDINKLDLKPGKLSSVDILIVGTDHKQLHHDSKSLINEKTVIIDGKNFFKKKTGKKVIGVGRVLN